MMSAASPGYHRQEPSEWQSEQWHHQNPRGDYTGFPEGSAEALFARQEQEGENGARAEAAEHAATAGGDGGDAAAEEQARVDAAAYAENDPTVLAVVREPSVLLFYGGLFPVSLWVVSFLFQMIHFGTVGYCTCAGTIILNPITHNNSHKPKS